MRLARAAMARRESTAATNPLTRRVQIPKAPQVRLKIMVEEKLILRELEG